MRYIIRDIFRVSTVTVARLGHSVTFVKAFGHSTGSILIYYFVDNDPGFHCYETQDTALNLYDVTGCKRATLIQLILSTAKCRRIHRSEEIAETLMPSSTAAYGSQPSHGHADTEESRNELSHGHVNTQAETAPTQFEPTVGGELASIPEGNEDEDTLILQQYHDELASRKSCWYANSQKKNNKYRIQCKC